MPDYQTLGKQMVHFGVGTDGLENKVNRLTAEGKIPDSDAKDLVTGYVNEALASKHVSAKAVYSLVQGFARWLYNGDYPTVLHKIYAKIAANGNIDFLREKNDTQGVQTVAKLAWEKNPELTLEYYKGADKNDLLRQIANHHADDYKAIGIVKRCLEALEDKQGLRQHAMKYFGQAEDLSVGILQELNTDEDFRTIVKHFSGTNPTKAYDFALQIKDKTDEDKAVFSRVKEEMIQKEPETAARKFWEHDPKCWRAESRRCTDQEGMIAAGKELVRQHKLVEAVDAFSIAEYQGDDVLELGLLLLKRYERVGFFSHREFKQSRVIDVMVKAVPAYLDKSPAKSAIKVNGLLGTECGEEVKRKLGISLAKCDLPSKAYDRMMDIKDKTAEDLVLIEELRKKVLHDIDQARYIFMQHGDKKGMRMFVKHAKATHTEYAYDNAFWLGDESLANPLRETLIAQKGIRYALMTFSNIKDEKGIKMVHEKLGQGIDEQTLDFLLDLEPKKKD